MIKDYLRMAFNSLTHRRMRTFLTLIGIFVGIAAVVSLVSISQGFQDYIETEFKELGADKITIMPKGASFGPVDGSSNPLTIKDREIIERSKGVDKVSYYRYKTAQMEWGKDDFGFNMVWAYPFDESREVMEEVATLDILDGRNLKDSDRYRVVVGYDYAYFNGFKENVGPGDKIYINGAEFKIVGVWEKIGNQNDDRAIVMPEDTFKEVFDANNDEVGAIMVKVREGEMPSEVVTNIEKDLRRFRGVKEGEEDFEVTTFEDLIDSFLNVFAIIGVVLVGIAGISLVVGGIGIMNTMYTAVLERTKEIGIMKAIGAKNSDIMMIFLIESGMLGLVGGILGVGIGVGLAKAIEYLGTAALGTELLKAALPWWLIVGALAFAFGLGATFGTLPAKRASEMNPVDALRTE